MAVKKPDAKQILDKSAFELENADEHQEALRDTTKKTSAIDYDWSGVNEGLEGMEAVGDRVQKRALGEDNTASYWARRQQGGDASLAQDPAALGKAMMMAAKQGSMQASQQAQAAAEQQKQFAGQAQQLQMTAYKTRMEMQKAELQLANQKQAIFQSVAQTRTGLELAQLQLKNMYNSGLANAKNAMATIDLNAKAADLQNMFDYLGMGLGAAASATAAVAGAGQKVGSTNSSLSGGGTKVKGPGSY